MEDFLLDYGKIILVLLLASFGTSYPNHTMLVYNSAKTTIIETVDAFYWAFIFKSETAEIGKVLYVQFVTEVNPSVDHRVSPYT